MITFWQLMIAFKLQLELTVTSPSGEQITGIPQNISFDHVSGKKTAGTGFVVQMTQQSLSLRRVYVITAD